MSLKYSNTTADFLEWDEAMNLIRKLYKDGNYNMSLLIALGCFFGLRIGDILSLRWNQILNASEFTIIEKKTGKKRTIRINPQLQRHISECYKAIRPTGINAPVLVSQKGTVFSVQRINLNRNLENTILSFVISILPTLPFCWIYAIIKLFMWNIAPLSIPFINESLISVIRLNFI